MGLYGAMRELLVDEGPLSAYYLYRLPDEQVDDVDVAHMPLSGIGAQRALGTSPVTTGPTGVTNDGGVLWYHTGVQVRVRGREGGDPLLVERTADDIRDVMVQQASQTRDGEQIVRCDVTNAAAYLEQDERERVTAYLTLELWHRRVRS